MPHLTATALLADPEGLAFLRAVLATAPAKGTSGACTKTDRAARAAPPDNPPCVVRPVLHGTPKPRRGRQSPQRYAREP